MTIHSISDRSAAVYLTRADLTPHGLTPATLTLTQARTLLRSLPIPLPIPLEIEAYPTLQGVMLFLLTPQTRPTPRRPLRQTRIRRRPT